MNSDPVAVVRSFLEVVRSGVEILGSGDKVYARWTQRGHHVGEVDGRAPTGAPVTQLTSAVYRVVDGLIVEYWIQIDRHGLRAQLER
ncbi:ester cyclase [Micromonospora sp. NPDC047670]|uniref:ester cyclase n=1 Tax=Micromonospora sp. NPDC047670 TaxID=3364252 RepID=UPI00371EC976